MNSGTGWKGSAKDPQGGELLTASDAARLLGVARSTFSRWRNAGRLPAPLWVSERPRWKRSELRAWLDADCPSGDQWEAMKGGR